MLTKRHLHRLLLLLWVEGTLDRHGTNESHGEVSPLRIAKNGWCFISDGEERQ